MTDPTPSTSSPPPTSTAPPPRRRRRGSRPTPPCWPGSRSSERSARAVAAVPPGRRRRRETPPSPPPLAAFDGRRGRGAGPVTPAPGAVPGDAARPPVVRGSSARRPPSSLARPPRPAPRPPRRHVDTTTTATLRAPTGHGDRGAGADAADADGAGQGADAARPPRPPAPGARPRRLRRRRRARRRRRGDGPQALLERGQRAPPERPSTAARLRSDTTSRRRVPERVEQATATVAGDAVLVVVRERRDGARTVGGVPGRRLHGPAPRSRSSGRRRASRPTPTL